MTQKEIKEKMTQGTWSVSPIYDLATDYVEKRCDCGYSSIIAKQENSLAITYSINNTYGKNINPESVSEMYNALKVLHRYLAGMADQEITDNIEDIIKKATL